MQDKCTITAHGAGLRHKSVSSLSQPAFGAALALAGAKLQLGASLAFNNSVSVDGDLEVVAAPQRRSTEACVQVNGSLYLNKGARLGIKGCRGRGFGGGLRVSADLRIHGGAMEFKDCTAGSAIWNYGGGAYVGGRLASGS